MLTRFQLEGVARKEGVPLHAVERDYVQHVLLRHAAAPPLTFKGGTCLRIAYGSPRYSEDLDFNADGAADEAMAHLESAAAHLADYGMPAQLARRPARQGLVAALRYEGPLFTGDNRSRGAIQFDISLRHEPVATEEIFVPRTPYADVPQLVLHVLTREQLFAEKARALAVRGKPRDLYDVHFLLSRGFTASREILDLKMGLYRRRFSKAGIERGIASAKRDWAQHLEPLLGQVPGFRVVADEVRQGLGSILASSA